MLDMNSPASHNGSHSYGSYFLEYSLMAELNLLLNQKLSSIYCILSAMSMPSLSWFLFIRQGPIRRGSSATN